jgi:hypothetical protein
MKSNAITIRPSRSRTAGIVGRNDSSSFEQVPETQMSQMSGMVFVKVLDVHM